MELKMNMKKLSAQLNKYKYGILVLVIGLLLMAVPSFSENDTAMTVEQPEIRNVSLEENLNNILSNVDGAGRVQVLLATSAGEETIYQTDESSNHGADSGNISEKTVTITDSDREQTGLVRQVISPVYQGAVVICQGGDIPTVKLAIIDAVSKITGLGVNQISVLKMK